MMWSDRFSAEMANTNGPGICTIHNRDLIKDSRYDCERSSHGIGCTCKDRYDCPECNNEFMRILQIAETRRCKECQCPTCHGSCIKVPINWNEGIVNCETCSGLGVKENRPHESHDI